MEKKNRELEEEQSPIMYLSDADYSSGRIKKQRHLIKFFAPWCGHCKSLHPTWEAMALDEDLARQVVIAKADCTGKAKRFCDEKGVQSYPVIKLVEGDEEADYEGARDHESIKEFALTASVPEARAEQEKMVAEKKVC